MRDLTQTRSLRISSRRQRTRDLNNYTARSRVAVAVDGSLERQAQLLLSRLQELAAIEGFLAGMRPQTEPSAGSSETAGKHLGIRSASRLPYALSAVVNSGPDSRGHADTV